MTGVDEATTGDDGSSCSPKADVSSGTTGCTGGSAGGGMVLECGETTSSKKNLVMCFGSFVCFFVLMNYESLSYFICSINYHIIISYHFITL